MNRWFIALFLLVLGLIEVRAQRFREEPVAPEQPTAVGSSNYFIDLNYTNIYDGDYVSDAISGEAGWYLFDEIDASLPDIWGDATMKIGPYGSMRFNSGIWDGDSYGEQIIVWTLGLTTRVEFPASFLQLQLQSGSLSGYFTRYSGYEAKRQDFVLAAELSYQSDAGRQQGEIFVPAWKMAVSGGMPYSTQQVFDWGYQELTHRLNDGSTNTNSIHAMASIDMFDVRWSEEIITPITVKGVGGKYNESIKYFGLGGGSSFLYQNKAAVDILVTKIWGWDNSKLNNFSLDFNLHLGFFQQLW